MPDILYADGGPYFALTAAGDVVEVAGHDHLEVSTCRELLEARRQSWVTHYRTSPHNTRRPPWLAEAPEEQP